MANQSTIKIELIVDDKGSVTIKQFGTDADASLKGVAKSAAGTSDKMTALKQTWTDLAVQGAAAWMAVSKAMSYMDEGAKALQIQSSFKIMAESSGAMADDMVANMKRATRETIDDSDLMQKAIKLMTLGYDPAQIERFSGVVITASQIAGTTATEAFERLSDAIANRMPKALVQMGAVTKDQMKIVNTAIESGADSMALFELAMANLELKQRMLQGTQDEATVALQKFHAQQKETGESIGQILIVAMQKLYGVFQSIGVASLAASAGFYKIAQGMATLESMTTFGEHSKKMKEAADAYKAAAESDFAAAAKLGQQAIDNFTGSAEAGKKATAQEIADAKKKVAAQMTVLGGIKDTAAAAKKAAEEREKAEQSIIEAIRKASYEVETIGQSQYNKDVARIEAEAAKYKKAGVDQVTVAKYVAVEMEVASKNAYEEMAKDARKATETAISEMEKEIAAGEKLTEAHIRGGEEYRKIVAGEYEFASTENERAINAIIAAEGEKILKIQVLYDKGNISFEEAETAKELIHKNHAAAILEKETENALKIAKLSSDMISGIRGWETDAYNARIAEIDAEADKKLKDLGADQASADDRTRIAAWVADQQELAFIKAGKSGSDFMAGVNAGYLEMERNAMTFGLAGAEIFNTFATASKTALSTILFDSIKTGTFDAQAVWTSFTDSMLRKFTDTISQMVVEAATEAVVMTFKAVTSGDWSDVLGLVNKAWDLGNSLMGGGTETTTGNTDYGWQPTVTVMEPAFGGLIRGNALHPGDHHGNDTIPARVSPGEYFEPRTAVNPQTFGMLEYIRKNKALPKGYFEGGYIPGYAEGGLVTDWVKSLVPSARLVRYDDVGAGVYTGVSWDQLDKLLATQRSVNLYDPNGFWTQYDATSTPFDGGWTATPHTQQTTYWSRGLSDWISSLPVIGNIADAIDKSLTQFSPAGYLLRSFMSPEEEMALRHQVGIAAASCGIGQYFGAVEAGSAAATAAAANDAWSGMAGAEAYGATTAGMEAGLSGMTANEAFQWALDKAPIQVKKWLINKALGLIGNSVFGGSGGETSYSFSAEGDLSGIGRLMGDIAPQSSQFAFSARDGLNYVPRDNFLIRGHEGEAVLTEKDAQEWRGGSARGGVNVTFNFPNALMVDKAAVNDLAEMIYPQLEKLRDWGH